ncbi:MAG: hypothetical protein QXP36_04665 [Conexivisphaerales archaeon]
MKYAIVSFDKDEPVATIKKQKKYVTVPLESIRDKGYIFFFNTDILKVLVFDVQETSNVYRKIVEYYGMSDIYFKTYQLGSNSIVVFAMRKDTYNTLVDLKVHKAFSLPFLVVYSYSKFFKAPVIFSDGNDYFYCEVVGNDVDLKIFKIREDLESYVKPILETREVFNLSPDKIPATSDYTDVEAGLDEIIKVISKNLSFDAFKQVVEVEKIVVPKNIIVAVVVLTIALLLKSELRSVLFSYTLDNVFPLYSYSATLDIPTIKDVDISTLSDFVYRKGTSYSLYRVTTPEGKEIIFPTLEDLQKYRLNYPGAKFEKLSYENNKLVNTEEIP